MTELTPAETADLDQRYTRTNRVLDSLVNDSRHMLTMLGPEKAAALLAAGFAARCPKTVASLLGAAIVRLQRQGKSDA